MAQRSRDLINGPLTLDYLVQKTAAGWKVSAVEWIREVDEAQRPQVAGVFLDQEIPYGLRLSEDGSHLEQNPVEKTVLLLILDRIVRERRITEIAVELNAEGLRTRGGETWSPSAVFELLPRLIEAGPSLLKSSDWQDMRHRRPAAN